MDKRTGIKKPVSLEHSSLKYSIPEKLLVDISKELHNINEYPSGGIYQNLSVKVADYFGVSQENVLPVNGSDEVIESVTRAFGSKLILIPIPTFSQYEVSADRNGFSKRLVPCLKKNIYQLDYSDDELRKASLVWICNPNNPTGNAIPRKKIIEILETSNGKVVVDECNYEYLDETVVDLINIYPNLIVSRSFSKNFGLAGIRLGFAVSSKENIEKIIYYCQQFRVNRIAEIAGIKVLDYLDDYQVIWEKIADIRDNFIYGLEQTDINVFPSKTNFVLADFTTKENTFKVWKYLRERDVYAFAAWGDEFSGLDNHYIRFTIGKPQEMNYVLSLLKDYKRLAEK